MLSIFEVRSLKKLSLLTPTPRALVPPCVTATSVSLDLIFAMKIAIQIKDIAAQNVQLFTPVTFPMNGQILRLLGKKIRNYVLNILKVYCTHENYALNSNFSCSLWHAEETCINRRNTKQETQTLSISRLPSEKFIRISFLRMIKVWLRMDILDKTKKRITKPISIEILGKSRVNWFRHHMAPIWINLFNESQSSLSLEWQYYFLNCQKLSKELNKDRLYLFKSSFLAAKYNNFPQALAEIAFSSPRYKQQQRAPRVNNNKNGNFTFNWGIKHT